MCTRARVVWAPPKVKMNEFIHDGCIRLCFCVAPFFNFSSALLFPFSFLFFFWELRCFFAIKAQRNQSVSVSLEQERKAKVYESGAAGATTNGLVMHLLYDNRVAGNTLLGSAHWGQPSDMKPVCYKAQQKVLCDSTQPKPQNHRFVLEPFCLCWRTQPF